MQNAIGGACCFGLVYLGIIVLVIASMWKVFVKAGKPGWAAIIPIYNGIILAEIAGKEWWWGLLFLIPFVGIVVAIIVMYNVALRFGKGVGFVVGLLLLPFIFWPILGFGSAQYSGTPTTH